MRIGITGYATAGKDEVANVLIEEFGFVKINMSDALDKYLRILNPWIMIGPEDVQATGWQFGTGPFKYEFICERLDFVSRKRIKDVRELLQRLGTDVGRAIDPNLWVNELDKEASKHKLVVTTGIRFEEETWPCNVLIHVDRPGVGPINDHSSENLDHIFRMVDVKIENNGSLEDLRRHVIAEMLMFGLERVP